VVGRPMTYGTTTSFLEYFGLKNLEEMPAADELRRIPVTKPPTLVTAEPGATPPPDQVPLSEVDQQAAAMPDTPAPSAETGADRPAEPPTTEPPARS